ncbi:Type IV secretory pathway, VirB5 component [Thiomonas arsenitoxydans]|nr:Type IV secretory pathway, VirB5 component [Thiomonas arsenitoxydans]CAZ90450.1 Type IV secretory pathway, VirB5 component [Thiomonas arsenitoxydans]
MKYLRFILIPFLFAMTQAAHAGIPVIDAANLAQAVQQVVAWGQQYGQMVNSLQNQIAAIKNMEGNFGMSSLSAAGMQTAQGMLPQSVNDLLNAINNPNGQYGQLQASIQNFMKQNNILDPNATFGAGTPAAQHMQGVQEQNATNLAAAQEAYKNITSGMTNIQSLITQVANSPSAKQTMNLQARIQAQNALIANSTNQLKALQLTQQAQAATEQEQDKERFIQSVTTPGPPLSW